jgi:hypothetical protein
VQIPFGLVETVVGKGIAILGIFQRNVTLLKELDVVHGKGAMAKEENGRKGMMMMKEEEVKEKEEDEEEPGAVKHFHQIAKNDDNNVEGVKRRNGIGNGKHKEREKEKLLLMEQRQLPAPPVYYIWESVLVVA